MSRIRNSFRFAWKGFRIGLKEQLNLRIHVGVSVLVLMAAYLLNVSIVEWAIILLCIAMVVSLELMNSAIESLVDMVSPEWKDVAGKVKDLSAAAVLVAAITASLIGLVIFGSHILTIYA
jgi:diacylglycerol kinase